MAADFDMLETIKTALGVTGDYQNATLQVYINEVNEYLKAAGVDGTLLNSELTAGVVARGVADLWNYGAGDGKLSPYFYERVIQLSRENGGDNGDNS